MADIVKYKFHKKEVNILPIFNEGFEYSYTDINENSIIVRTITSESNPTSISFKDKEIVKIESLNLTNVEELDIDNLELNVITNAASLISNCATLKVLRAKANVVNELIPHLQAKTNLNSGTIKASDVSYFINNNELNMKNWYIDEHRYVDLFVMMGEANMKGHSEKTEVFEVPTYKSYTYMYNTDALGQVKNPYGEWINNQVTDEALKQQWLADPTMDGAWWQMEGAEGGQQGEAYASLQPYFADEYYNQTKVPTVMVQCACGNTAIDAWLPGHAQGRYELSVEKVTRAIAKIEAEIDRPIRNKYLIWLQGGSDAINSTGTDSYKTKFVQLWNALKQDCGLEKCFITRVAKFRDSEHDVKPIIEAQEQLTQENDDIIISTRIAGLLEYPTTNAENPTIQDGVTEGYPHADYYTVAGYKLVGETIATKIAEFINLGLRPKLESEPYEGEITSSSESLIVSYKYKGTASLLPSFDKSFDYRIIDTKDANGYTDRKIVSSYIPGKISFQAKTNLLAVNYIDTSEMNTAYGMFYNCKAMTYLNMPYVTKVKSMEGMLNGCTALKTIVGMDKWDTSNNNNWGSTFRSLKVIESLNIENFILANSHAMGSTFQDTKLKSFEGFDLKKWRTPYVQYLSTTFGFLNVTELDLSSLDVRLLGSCSQTFSGCSALVKLNLSNWILTEDHYCWEGPGRNPLTLTLMFKNCTSLKEIIMKNSNRFSIYKIAELLPTRTVEDPGTLITSMDEEVDNELLDLLTSKRWNIQNRIQAHEYEITSYCFDPSVGNLFPVFNEDFRYTYTDQGMGVHGILRTIKSTELPTEVHFGTTHVSQEDASSLLKILSLESTNISDYSNMFKNCNKLNYIGSGIISEASTNLSSMFEGCSSLDFAVIYNCYTNNVNDASNMFKGCTNMKSLDVRDFEFDENANRSGMFDDCINLSSIECKPEFIKAVASNLPTRPFTQPGDIKLRRGAVSMTDALFAELTTKCDEEMLINNWITDRNRHLDLFVMMGQSNMQGQSETYKEFNVPQYQSCTYLYNTDEIAQVKHPFGENIQTLGTVEDLGYWQLEGAVGCNTGLPYGSLSPHFAASYYEETHTPTLMVQCARGATTMKDWLPGTTQQRFEIAVEKTQKSIAAVEGIGRTIRGKYLVWLQGESDGAGTGVGTKKATYKTRFLNFWNAIKEQLGFEKCFIIRVHKFRDGYSYNCFPIIEAQEELALENDDIEMVTRVTGYLQYYDENPEHYTIQHAFQGLQITGNHDHYTWEGYKLVGDTAGSRVGQYINTGIMPALEEEPWPAKVTASSNCHVATYKFDNTIYANYVPEFNEGYQYRVIDTVESNITTRQIIGVGLPTLMRFGAYYTYEELNGGECSATARELCLKEIVFADTSAVTDATNMFCFNSNLTSLPAMAIKDCSSLYAMFYECTSLTNIDARNFNVSKTTDVENFVYHCSNLTSVNIEGWNTSNVVNMYGMFMNSENLTEIIGIKDLNVDKVKTMISVFEGCHSIKNLDLSNWNVENVTTILGMFRNCNALEILDLSNWHLVNCKNYSQALQGCDMLTNVTMRYSDYNTINNVIAQLPSKTVDASGTLLINNVDVYEQVDLEAATAKYWNTEHRREMINFNKKIVNGEMLNKFAKKMNKEFKSNMDSLETGVDSEELMAMLNELYGEN